MGTFDIIELHQEPRTKNREPRAYLVDHHRRQQHEPLKNQNAKGITLTVEGTEDFLFRVLWSVVVRERSYFR